jgi:intraflagellar transport protein 88
MRVPTDPGVLAHLAAIHSKDDNEPEALHCYEQSYRYFPVNIDVVSALGAHNVSSDLYEKAIQFFRYDFLSFSLSAFK